MFKRLDEIEQRFNDITEKMADPEVATNSNELIRLAKGSFRTREYRDRLRRTEKSDPGT